MKMHRILLGVALLLMLVQTTVLLNTRWVEDESWNTDCALTWLREGRLRMSSFPVDEAGKVDTRPPLTPLVLAASLKTLGVGPVPGRIPAVIGGLLTVAVVYLLGLELAGPLVGGLAALFAAVDNFLVISARTMRPEIFTSLFCTLGVLLFYYSRRRKSGWLSFLAAISAGIAVDFHPLGMGGAAAIGFLYILEFRQGFLAQRRTWMFIAGILVSVLPFAIWILADPVNIHAFVVGWGGRASESLIGKVLGEFPRYAELLGVANLRLKLGVPIPLRLHIVAVLVGAFLLLFRAKRALAVEIAGYLAVNILWWTFLTNKTPRVFAFFAPIFAFVTAWGVLYLAQTMRRPRFAMAIAVICIGSQFLANAWFIYRYRAADYTLVTRQLRELIPDRAASVYGIITFYTALNDHPYFSCDRTPFDYALNQAHVQYLILYDRVMMNGSAPGTDDFAALRRQLTDFARSGRADLVGRVNNDFYGDMEIYKVKAP
jgi:4-amino-4-deoxy-L-arabinose transferase-like glycosyltransferase